MSNRIAYGASTRPGSHIAPGARCNNVIQLAGAIPSRLRHRLHGPDARNDRALFYPAIGSLVGQREDRLSETFPPAGGRAAQAESFVTGQGSGLSHLFSSRAALKLFQFSNAVFEVAKSLLLFLMCLFGGAVITGSILCWLFLF